MATSKVWKSKNNSIYTFVSQIFAILKASNLFFLNLNPYKISYINLTQSIVNQYNYCFDNKFAVIKYLIIASKIKRIKLMTNFVEFFFNYSFKRGTFLRYLLFF